VEAKLDTLFYLSAVVAVIAALMVILEQNPVHALLYLVMSMLSTAVIFFLLGAPFGAALEVIIYAGAIMVLFVFVVMMIDPGPQGKRPARAWFGPLLLAAALLVELVYILRGGAKTTLREVGPQEVGEALFGPYVLGVELASMLLLSGLIGACHLGRGYRSDPKNRPAIAGETKKDFPAARPSKEL
jgi:NADH-quinone oxidoreductase subunit J